MWLLSVLYLAQQSSSNNSVDLGPALQQIGIGVLIAVPAYVMAWKLWQDRGQKDTKIQELQDAQVRREHELSDRLAPLLASAVEVLSQAPKQFDQALSEAHSAIRSSEIDRAMDRIVNRLETTVEKLKDQP